MARRRSLGKKRKSYRKTRNKKNRKTVRKTRRMRGGDELDDFRAAQREREIKFDERDKNKSTNYIDNLPKP